VLTEGPHGTQSPFSEATTTSAGQEVTTCIVLSSHLCLDLPNSLFPSGFSYQNPICTCALPFFVPLVMISSPKQYLVRSTQHEDPYYVLFSICLLLPLCPKYLSQPLLLNTVSLHSYHQFWRPSFILYKTAGSTIYFKLFLLDNRLEDIVFWIQCQQTFPKYSLLLTSPCIQFWFASVLSKCLNFPILPKHLLSVPMLWFCLYFVYKMWTCNKCIS
jgi:hypothetical protein